MKNFFLASTFSIFAATNLFAADINPCAGIKTEPNLVFVTSYGKLVHNYEHNQTELTEMSRGYGLHEDGMLTSGLSIADISWEIEINTSTRLAEDNKTICVIPTSVDVFVGFTNPILYIANNLQKGSCSYNLALLHEYQHQQINVAALEYFVPKIKKTLQIKMSSISPLDIKNMEDADTATHELNEKYIAIVEPVINEFKTTLLNEQKKLDSRQNYEKETALCR